MNIKTRLRGFGDKRHRIKRFQRDGVRFLQRRYGRGIIGDEMGLGKTAQALAWLYIHPELRPALIICPAYLKINWRDEARTWMHKKIQVLSSTKPRRIKRAISVIGYPTLSHWSDALIALRPKVIIIDEGHNIQNPTAKRTLATKHIARRVPHIIVLTGTPAKNRPRELFNSIRLVEPSLFKSHMHFLQRYCGPKYSMRYGWSFDGATNTKELHKKLKQVMIRRLKKDVMKELPAKRKIVVPLQINNQKKYDEAETHFIKWLRKHAPNKLPKARKAFQLVQMNELRTLVMQGKMQAVIEWLEDFLRSGRKAIVFCTRTYAVDTLMQHFGKLAVRLDGKTKDKRGSVVAFQKKPHIKLIIGNNKVMSEGHTLTAASDVVHVQLGWTPGEDDQANDRAHRIGQNRKVLCWYLLCPDTIDEDMMRVQDRKRRILSRVLDGKRPEREQILEFVMKRIKMRVQKKGHEK